MAWLFRVTPGAAQSNRSRVHRGYILTSLCALAPAVLANPPGGTSAAAPAPVRERPKYRSSRTPSGTRWPDRPSYVRTLAERLDEGGPLAGLEFGIEQRSRFELRDDFYAAELRSDDRYFTRTRGWIGLRESLDPFRFGFEFQDSQRFASVLPGDDADINVADIQQAFAELYFADALGANTPLSLRAGRMSFDAIDRRLFSRNGFRNTTNAFEGFRLRLGDEQSLRELDLFAFQPVARRLTRPDRGDEERWLYGVNGYIRDWAPWITLEPYYFILDEDRKEDVPPDREVHTLGFHAFGVLGESGFDYDVNLAYQIGERTDGDIRAFAAHSEVGYQFEHPWEPRLALMFNYATGDDDPNDQLDERFDRLFGSSHTFYGFSDLFRWQNLVNPALFITFRPTQETSVQFFYRVYWNEAAQDGFVVADLFDRTGGSGRFVGQGLDLSVRHELDENVTVEVGYAHFFPGSYVDRAGSAAPDSDFFYVEMTLTF